METKEEIIWEQEEVAEQPLQEDETSPILRKSVRGKHNTATDIAAVDIIEVSNGVSESNGHAAANGAQNEISIPAGEDQKLEEPHGIQKIEQSVVVLEVGANGTKEEGSTHGEEQRVEDLEAVFGGVSQAINGEPEPESLVFYDKVEGIWKCGICSWTYQNGSDCVDHIQTHKGQIHHKLMSVQTLKFELEGVGSTYTHIAEKQNLKFPEDNAKFNTSSLDSVVQVTAAESTFEGGLENDHFPGSKIQPSQNPFKDHGKSNKSCTEIESVEVDLINEDDLEVTEFDVERVLQKQTTHDLYCPNCNSCITKRVILHKRKRRIQISEEEVKRNKKEPVATSKVGVGTAESPRDQVLRTDEVIENDTPLLRADEDEHNQGPDIFRCLSCFSFFIPIRNGFKSFRLFGENNGKESVVDEQDLNVKKNRFTSMFASNKQKTALWQGSISQTHGGTSDAVVASSNSNDQIGQPSSLEIPDSPSHASEENVAISGNDDIPKSGDEILSFPEQKPLSNGKVMIAVRDQLDMATTRTVDATTTREHSDAYTEDQQKKPDYISHKSDLPVTAVPTDDGLKLLISSDKVSLAPENMKDSEISNQTVQSGGASADKEVIHHPAASVSVLKASDMNGKLNNSVSAPHEKEDARAAAPIQSVLENENATFRSNETSESPFIITKPKIEVHSDKPFKVDRISYSPAGQGKDAVITIVAQPAGSSQIVPNVIHLTETTTSLQPDTQIGSAGRERTEAREDFEIEVIKSIVYGGLAESITSLGVVLSAAGSGAAALYIVALGMANLIGGLSIICHNIWELRNKCMEQVSSQISEGVIEQRDRYKELLGQRQNFIIHAAVAIISYLVFGLVPPVAYGFSFSKTDDKQLKLVVVTAASLICIALLAVGRAYVQRPPKPYMKSVATFVILGFMVSGVSYAAGELVERLLVKLGLFQSGTVSNLLVAEMTPKGTAWASY